MTTVDGGAVLVIICVVGTTSPFGRVVDVSDVNVVGGGVMMVVSVSGVGSGSGAIVVHDVANSVSVGLVSVIGIVMITGTCAVETAPGEISM